MPQHLHIYYFTWVRYYKIAKKILFKAELVFHSLPPLSPNSTGRDFLPTRLPGAVRTHSCLEQVGRGMERQWLLASPRDFPKPMLILPWAWLTQTTCGLKRSILLLATMRLAFQKEVVAWGWSRGERPFN